MNIPKSFRPENKEKVNMKTEILLKIPVQKTQISNKKLEALLEKYEKFLHHSACFYRDAERLIEDAEYSKHELQSFCDRLRGYEGCKRFEKTGVYLSAAINKVTKKGRKMVLELPYTEIRLDWVGYYFSKGTLVIKGDLGNKTAYCMEDGKLIVEGETGKDTGNFMSGGELHAKRIESLGDILQGGKIFEDGKKVRDRTGY